LKNQTSEPTKELRNYVLENPPEVVRLLKGGAPVEYPY
jgi:hypothetical protein